MLFHWNPNPIAFSIEAIHLHVYWYGIFFATGFFLAYSIGRVVCRKNGMNVDKLDALLLLLFLGTIVGARLAHVLFYQPDYYMHHLVEIFYVWQGGLASHGGTIGAFLGFCYFCWKNRDYKPLWMLDNMAMAVALVAGFIRLGNFMNSEIVGIPTDGSYGIIFDRLGPEALHPVQLYESCSYFFISLVMYIMYRLGFGNRSGLMFGIFFTWTFLTRMILEVFKSSQAEYETQLNDWVAQYVHLPFTISVGMLLSVPFVLVGIGFIIYGLRHPPKTEQEPLHKPVLAEETGLNTTTDVISEGPKEK